jgi:hypothetical protein
MLNDRAAVAREWCNKDVRCGDTTLTTPVHRSEAIIFGSVGTIKEL